MVIYVLLSKLVSKDVVNVESGEKLGKIRDVEIDFDTGMINCLIVSPNQPISTLIKKNKITE